MKTSPLKIALLLLLTLISLVIAVCFWSGAFPIASVPFKVSRGEAEVRLSAFIESLGYPVVGYRSAISFGEESTEKNFIERQAGVRRLEELTRKGLAVWYWTGRWFKAGQHEEFGAWLDPRGNILGFSHTIEEERPLPFLTKAEARALAEKFLQTRITQHPWAALRFKEESTDKKTNRADYTFSWERDDLRLGDAPYRLWVVIQGNAVGGYGEGLTVPEWWSRDFAQKRSINQLCENIATYALMAIFVGSLVLFILAIKNRRIRWSGAAPWGWLVLFAIIALAASINNFPASLFGYATTQSWPAFLASSGFSTLRKVLGELFGLYVLFLIADSIYREKLPRLSSFRRALGPMALSDPQTVRALGTGIVFAVFALAYVSLFYVIGQRYGVWCPIEIDYSKTLGGWLPWAEPIQTGLTAAFGEEMLFRVVALFLVWRIVRVRWLAILISAATWGFLHSSYAQMPGYVRGIELTIVGILWALLLLRYGVVATLTAHYLYDCWLGSLIVFQSPSWGNKACALVVSLWPVALFFWGWLKEPQALEPEEEPALPPALPAAVRTEPAWDFTPRFLSSRQMLILTAASVVALASAHLIPQPQAKLEKLGHLDLTREQIGLAADGVMRRRGYSPEKYHRTVSVSEVSTASQYLLEKGSLDRLAGFFGTERPDLLWNVRYFQILQREEFRVSLDQHGRAIGWSHEIPREAFGAQLDRDAALAVVRRALTQEMNVDLTRENLVGDYLTQQEHRRDWSFVFERKDFGWGEAKLRTVVSVQGDEPHRFGRFVKVPEAWILEHARKGWKKFATSELQQWLAIAEAGLFCVFFVLLIRRHIIPWRQAFWIALFPLALSLVNLCNHVPWFLADYATTIPLPNYLIQRIGGGALGVLLAYLGEVFVIAVGLGLMRWAFDWSLKELTLWPAGITERRRFWWNNVVLGFVCIALLALIDGARNTISGYWLPDRVAQFSFWNVEESVPWIGGLTAAFKEGFNQVFRAAIFVGFIRLVWRRFPKTAWALLLLSPLLSAVSEETWRGFIFHLAFGEIDILVIAFLLVFVWRFNPLLIFMVYAGNSLIGSAWVLIEKGGPAYRWQAAPMLILCIAAAMAGLFGRRQSPPTVPVEPVLEPVAACEGSQ